MQYCDQTQFAHVVGWLSKGAYLLTIGMRFILLHFLLGLVASELYTEVEVENAEWGGAKHGSVNE